MQGKRVKEKGEKCIKVGVKCLKMHLFCFTKFTPSRPPHLCTLGEKMGLEGRGGGVTNNIHPSNVQLSALNEYGLILKKKQSYVKRIFEW